jgi:SAM-dependent methyltransferase
MTVEDSSNTFADFADVIAPGWERQRARIEDAAAPVRAWLVRELEPRPGHTVLELAAGAGDTGFEVAAFVGERGRLLSTDVSPAMVDVARRRGRELGVENVDYAVVDVERIELAPDSVDRVVCRFGYMLVPDPAAALGETRRVLRSGGRLALAVWGAPEDNPWATSLVQPLVELGHLPPFEPGAPGPFSLGSDVRLRALLADAGFPEIRVEAIPVRFTVRDLDDYLSFAADTAGPMAMVLRGLTPAQRPPLEQRIAEAIEPFAADAGYALPGVALAAVAS